MFNIEFEFIISIDGTELNYHFSLNSIYINWVIIALINFHFILFLRVLKIEILFIKIELVNRINAK